MIALIAVSRLEVAGRVYRPGDRFEVGEGDAAILVARNQAERAPAPKPKPEPAAAG